MKFYDRAKELNLLADIHQKSLEEAQMTVLVGRRRIGKTELVLKCGHDHPLLYFFVAASRRRCSAKTSRQRQSAN